jgi:tryptophan-rich sensory protein
MKASKLKAHIIFILTALIVGGLAAFLVKDSMAEYNAMSKPALSPPAYVFPVAWTLPYVLMGAGAALVYNSGAPDRWKALTIYALQLAANFLWPLIFFGLGAKGWAFVWLLLLFALVLAMALSFWKISRKAALLQIPYLAWLLFAGYLNLATILMNR